MSQPTRSERIFESYCAKHGLPAVRIPESKNKEPDYRLDFAGSHVFFEVKELGVPKPFPTEGFSPLPYIQRRIKKAREKFDQYRESCCCAVLYNDSSIVTSLSPYYVLSAMLGECYQRHGNEALSFSGKAILTAAQNTTVSAVITLRPLPLHYTTVMLGERWHERQAMLGRALTDDEVLQIQSDIFQQPVPNVNLIIRATVLKNPYAPKPLSDAIFQGPFDERWEQHGGIVTCAFRGELLTKLWKVLPEYALTAVSGQY